MKVKRNSWRANQATNLFTWKWMHAHGSTTMPITLSLTSSM